MQLEEHTVGEVTIVRVTGEICLKKGSDRELHDTVRSLLQRGHRKVIMDLAGVSYVDSAGLGELIQTHSTVKDHGGLLKLSNPTGRLRDVLVLARLHTILQVYESEALALESFAALQ